MIGLRQCMVLKVNQDSLQAGMYDTKSVFFFLNLIARFSLVSIVHTYLFKFDCEKCILTYVSHARIRSGNEPVLSNEC